MQILSIVFKYNLNASFYHTCYKVALMLTIEIELLVDLDPKYNCKYYKIFKYKYNCNYFGQDSN